MKAEAWVNRLLGLLLTVSPSLHADEIEIIGRLQIQAQLESAGGRARVTGRLLDELGRPVQGTLVVRATDPPQALPLEPCLLGTETDDPTTHLSSAEQGDFCAWLSHSEEQVSIVASADHYQNTHLVIQRDQSPLLPPRFIAAPTTLTRGSTHVNTVKIRVSAADPIPTAAGQIALGLRCASTRSSLGKQPISSSQVVFEFVTPADAALGTCQLEAEASSLGKAPARTQADVLVQAEVTLGVSQINVSADTAIVELIARAGDDIPKGAIEATRGSVVLGSVPIRPHGPTPVEVPLIAQADDVMFRIVSGSSEYVAGAPVSVTLPALTFSQPDWLWHSIAALCFVAWLTWRWLLAARPRSLPAATRRTASLGRATAQPQSSGAIRGSVLDAHTQKPLAAVQLTLIEPRADGETVVESTVSNLRGEFQFATQFSGQSLLRLRAEHEHFMTLATAVTAATFVVELRSTRRAVLESLVAWARRSGRPWDVAPAPTTGHVRQIAAQRQEPHVGTWATEVERAAFGPDSPSEPEVTELLGRSPKDPRKTSSL